MSVVKAEWGMLKVQDQPFSWLCQLDAYCVAACYTVYTKSKRQLFCPLPPAQLALTQTSFYFREATI